MFWRNRPNHDQIFIEKTAYIADTFTVENCYSAHNFSAPREKFEPNLLFYSEHLNFFVGK